jgi:uncharacterized protein YbbC (DUF1343 family)/CubicO group peptidase (beta-lactamase class C family)
MKKAVFVYALLAWAAFAQETFSGSADIDRAIEDAIHADQIPGAVALIGHDGKVVHRKAYGSRSLVPRREPMTFDTIFDAASLTKVVATTSAVMKLFEQGRLRLNDPVTDYLPEFQGGKSAITVRQLLTHFSGFRPDVDLEPEWSGYQTGIQKALVDKPVAAPGERFIYSDINFILLGEIVTRLAGKSLPEYVRENIFVPLGMKESMFQPGREMRDRIAPTERVNGSVLRGVVHDPTTRYMGGVAGHAGLFTTAADLSKFAEMMLGQGQRNGTRIFSPVTVEKFITPQTPANQGILRGLGWDIDSQFSSNRGELFPIGSYGHTGFTGTSLWIDPYSRTYVVLMTNSVHPNRRPAISSLRGRVATITAAAFGITGPEVRLTGYNETLVGAGIRRQVARNGHVLTGLDVLAEDQFRLLKGKAVGLITNHTGIDRFGRRNVDLMVDAGIRVAGLFAPEHGMSGREDHENVAHSRDSRTGIPIWSLYSGPNRKPSPEMLRGIDVLVYDIQDVGVRFYTYTCTMRLAMIEAGQRHIPFMVLDRPNPITGVRVEGPVLEPGLESFVGCAQVPVRHGMTIGEIARMLNDEQKIGANLQVIPMKNWQRGDWFDSTGLPWVDPSPNLKSLNAATVYPGVALIELSTNYSVGRGTDAPFEQIGAAWIQGADLAAYLNDRHIPGIRVYPTNFQPSGSNFAGQPIQGVRFVVTDREALDAVRLGLEIAGALEKLYPGKIPLDRNLSLIGSRAVVAAIRAGEDPRIIHQRVQEALGSFVIRREKYLLYR